MITALTAKILGYVLMGVFLAIGIAYGHKIHDKIETAAGKIKTKVYEAWKKSKLHNRIMFAKHMREARRDNRAEAARIKAEQDYRRDRMKADPTWAGTREEFLERLTMSTVPGWRPRPEWTPSPEF